MKKRLTLVVAAVALALVASVESGKANLASNGSFEAPITGSWTVTAPTDWTLGGSGGVWQPLLYPAAGLGPADGQQIGYLNGGTMSQDLGVILQPNTTYNLSIEVAGRADGYNPGTGYSVSLYAGSPSGTLLTSVTPVTPTSTWTTLTASYSSAIVPSGDLFVVISSPATQFDFDNVVVSAVPEPTTMIAGALLLLPFGASTLRMLRKSRTA
jgi:hypothetical protein